MSLKLVSTFLICLAVHAGLFQSAHAQKFWMEDNAAEPESGWSHGTDRPQIISVSHGTNLYVACSEDATKKIYIYQVNGKSLTKKVTVDGLGLLGGFTVDSAGDFYVLTAVHDTFKSGTEATGSKARIALPVRENVLRLDKWRSGSTKAVWSVDLQKDAHRYADAENKHTAYFPIVASGGSSCIGNVDGVIFGILARDEPSGGQGSLSFAVNAKDGTPFLKLGHGTGHTHDVHVLKDERDKKDPSFLLMERNDHQPTISLRRVKLASIRESSYRWLGRVNAAGELVFNTPLKQEVYNALKEKMKEVNGSSTTVKEGKNNFEKLDLAIYDYGKDHLWVQVKAPDGGYHNAFYASKGYVSRGNAEAVIALDELTGGRGSGKEEQRTLTAYVLETKSDAYPGVKASLGPPEIEIGIEKWERKKPLLGTKSGKKVTFQEIGQKVYDEIQQKITSMNVKPSSEKQDGKDCQKLEVSIYRYPKSTPEERAKSAWLQFKQGSNYVNAVFFRTQSTHPGAGPLFDLGKTGSAAVNTPVTIWLHKPDDASQGITFTGVGRKFYTELQAAMKKLKVSGTDVTRNKKKCLALDISIYRYRQGSGEDTRKEAWLKLKQGSRYVNAVFFRTQSTHPGTGPLFELGKTGSADVETPATIFIHAAKPKTVYADKAYFARKGRCSFVVGKPLSGIHRIVYSRPNDPVSYQQTLTDAGGVATGVGGGYLVLFTSQGGDDRSRQREAPRNLGAVHVSKDFDESAFNFVRKTKPKEGAWLDDVSKYNGANFTSRKIVNSSGKSHGVQWLTTLTGQANASGSARFLSAERPKLVHIKDKTYLALWEEHTIKKKKGTDWYDFETTYAATKAMKITLSGTSTVKIRGSAVKNIDERPRIHWHDDPVLFDSKATWVTATANTLVLHQVDEKLQYTSQSLSY